MDPRLDIAYVDERSIPALLAGDAFAREPFTVCLGDFGLRHLANEQVAADVVTAVVCHVRPPASVHLYDEIDASVRSIDRVEIERNARLAAAIEDIVQLLIQTAVGKRDERGSDLRAIWLLLLANAIEQEAPAGIGDPFDVVFNELV